MRSNESIDTCALDVLKVRECNKAMMQKNKFGKYVRWQSLMEKAIGFEVFFADCRSD